MAPRKCWLAVLNRDSKFDGRFVYAVRSTGIYCRPTCPSRRPGRSQVLFFGAPGEAERAGFRPCRRCEPESARRRPKLISDVCRYLESNLPERLPLQEIGRKFNISPSHLHRVFKRALGVSMTHYAKACRLESFKAAIRRGSDVTTAIYEAGFGSSSRLYEVSDSSLGMTPAVYKKGGNAIRIRYMTSACSLGRLLVASTDRGICAVTLGNSDAELISALQAEYPHAGLERDKSHLRQALSRLLRHLSGVEVYPELPLDIQATAFQRRVWEELQRIPSGTTRSYSEIASRIGSPGAARAVANACASNPVALLIPCHRVVAKDGGQGGYRWGKDRKRKLLKKESSRRG